MYIRDGIAYAGEQKSMLMISGVCPMADYQLWVRFNNGEEKVFDFRPLLDVAVYAPLKDVNLFNAVYIDYGCPVWNDGQIDIAPEHLYKHGVAVGGVVSA